MPTGNLPASGKKLWEDVYDKALKGSCKGDKSCAAASAWKAVKNAGWYKDKKGDWHKKADVQIFSMAITKANYDEKTGQMRWRASVSDINTDKHNDNMSIALYESFLHRIETSELPPEQYRSDFWSGGMPYLSISHYHDLEGKGVPGMPDASYIDGDCFKAKGYLYDTDLGRAVFRALCDDLHNTSESEQDKIRISIAFLDWKHRHKDTGFIFERSSMDDLCPQCFKELVLDEERSGREFLDGHLIHYALTRVPVNPRTDMEVDKAMTTRKEDASSIVGEELAEMLEEESTLVGKSEAAMIVKAEDQTEEDEEDQKKKQEEDEEMEEEGCGKKKEEKAVLDMFSEIMNTLSEMKSTPPAHPLDGAIANLKSAVDTSDGTQEAMDSIQQSLNELGEAIKSMIEKPQVEEEKSETGDANLGKAISEALKPVMEQLALLTAELNAQKQVNAPVQRPTVPTPRSIQITPELLQRTQVSAKSATPKLRALIERTT